VAKVDGVLLDRAKRMRREPTPAEAMLWRQLRGRQISGVKFTRQFVIGPTSPTSPRATRNSSSRLTAIRIVTKRATTAERIGSNDRDIA